MPKIFPLELLGLNISGDIGGYTMYQDRWRRLEVYPRSPPEVPCSAAQRRRRYQFAVAVQNWRDASEAVRQAYERASLKASLMATGHNLWIRESFRQDAGELATLEAHTGEVLPLPPAVRGLEPPEDW